MVAEFDASWTRLQQLMAAASKQVAAGLLPVVTDIIQKVERAFAIYRGEIEYTFGDALNDTINATFLGNINAFLTVLETALNESRAFFHDAIKSGFDGIAVMANEIIDFINRSMIRPILNSPVFGGVARTLGLQEIGRAESPVLGGSETLEPIVLGRAAPAGVSSEEFNRREFARGLLTRGTLAGSGSLEEMYTDRSRPAPQISGTSDLGRGTQRAGPAPKNPEEDAIREAARHVPLNTEDGRQQGQQYRQLAERARAAGLDSLARDMEYKARSAEVRQQRSDEAKAKRDAERISRESSRSTPSVSTRSYGGGGGTIRTGDKIEVNFNIEGSTLSDLELTRLITELLNQHFIDLGLVQP